MTKRTALAIALATSLLAGPALATDDLVESVRTGCQKELESYCKEVTPGAGRVLACLYAHGDKLSGRCEYALYDAAAQLERAVAALSYVANECDADIEKQCGDVEIGEGRIVACLREKPVSDRCSQALDDVGL